MIEWSSRNLLAVDADDSEHAQLVADFLVEQEKKGHLIYKQGAPEMRGSDPQRRLGTQ
jgi:hypothetical protein